MHLLCTDHTRVPWQRRDITSVLLIYWDSIDTGVRFLETLTLTLTLLINAWRDIGHSQTGVRRHYIRLIPSLTNPFSFRPTGTLLAFTVLPSITPRASHHKSPSGGNAHGAFSDVGWFWGFSGVFGGRYWSGSPSTGCTRTNVLCAGAWVSWDDEGLIAHTFFVGMLPT